MVNLQLLKALLIYSQQLIVHYTKLLIYSKLEAVIPLLIFINTVIN